MDTRTLEALRDSIAKWEKIALGTGADYRDSNCPLCQLFSSPGSLDCGGCPVKLKTGYDQCLDSPFIEWATLPSIRLKLCRRAETPEEIAAAQAEVDFLRSLLPENR